MDFTEYDSTADANPAEIFDRAAQTRRRQMEALGSSSIFERSQRQTAEREQAQRNFQTRFGFNAEPEFVRGLMDAYETGAVDEDGVYRNIGAKLISDNLLREGIDIPAPLVLANMDSFLGILGAPVDGKGYVSKSNLKAIMDSFAVSAYSTERSMLGMRRMAAETEGRASEIKLIEERLQLIDRQLQDYGDNEKRNPLVWAMEMAAQSSVYTAGLAAASAVPVLGFVLGGASMGGGVYNDLRDAGVEVKIAAGIALGVGALESAIEAQLGMEGGIVSRVTGAKTLQGTVSKIITQSLVSRLGSKGVWVNAAVGIVARFIANAAGEGIDEVLQEITEIGGLELAKLIQKEGITVSPGDEKYVKRVIDAGAAGFASALVMGFAGMGADAVLTVSDMHKVRSLADAIPSQEAFNRASKEYFNKDLSAEEIAAQQKIIFEGRRNVREKEEAKAAAELKETAALGEGYAEQKANEETGEPVPLGEAYRKKDGGWYTELDGKQGLFKFGDARVQSGTNLYGHIEYRTDAEGRVTVEGFKVRPDLDTAENRRSMWSQFSEAFAGDEIVWEPSGEGAVNIREDLIRGNPQGEQAGLNYFAGTDGGNMEQARYRNRVIDTARQYFPQLGNAEHAVMAAELEHFADRAGLSLEGYVNREFFGGLEKMFTETPNKDIAAASKDGKQVKGAVIFGTENDSGAFVKSLARDAKAIIYVTEHSDLSTFIHEMGHIYRRRLQGEMLAEAERLWGVTGGTWTTAQEEQFTEDLERWRREGVAPKPEMESFFKKFAEFLKKIANAVSKRARVSPEIAEFFDKLYAGEQAGESAVEAREGPHGARTEKDTAGGQTTRQRAAEGPSGAFERQAAEPEPDNDPESLFITPVKERMANIERLRNAPAIKLDRNAYQGKYELNKESIMGYLRGLKNEAIKNNYLNDEIHLSNRGIKKIIGFGLKNDVYLRLFAHIPKIAEKAVFITDEKPNRPGTPYNKYSHLIAGIEMNDKPYTVHIILGENNGVWYYDQIVTEIEKGSIIAGIQVTTSGLHDVSHSDIKDTALLRILQAPRSITSIGIAAKDSVNSNQEKTSKNDIDFTGTDETKQKFEEAPGLAGRSSTIRLGGRKIKGHYELKPTGAATPSHNPFNSFRQNEGFWKHQSDGASVNRRNYEGDMNEQAFTLKIASHYNGEALGGIVVYEGKTISGNGREQAGQIAARQNTDGEYLEDLRDEAEKYGLDGEAVQRFISETDPHPRLYFVVDETLEINDQLFAEFNLPSGKGQSPLEDAVNISKQIRPETVKAIAGVIDGYETIEELYKDKKALLNIFNTLGAARLIGEFDLPLYFTERGGITGAGEDLLENTLLGAVLEEGNIRRLAESKGIRRKLSKALPHLVENRAMGNYSVISEVNEAARIAVEVDLNRKTWKSVGDWAAQRDFDFMERRNQVVIELARRLDGKEQSGFADMMGGLNAVLREEAKGQSDMFGGTAKEDILRRYLGVKAEIDEVRAANNKTIADESAPGIDRVTAALENAGLAKGEADGTLLQYGWHGSHTDFDSFEDGALSSGYGEMDFGWGHCVASRKGVAKWYRKTVSAQHQSGSGQVYKVTIPEDIKMLHWNKPMSKQPADIRRIIEAAAQQSGTPQKLREVMQDQAATGEKVYRWMSFFQGWGDKRTSKYLASKGIKGIKYFDTKSSRNAGGRSDNYVIFNQGDITIVDTLFDNSTWIGNDNSILFQLADEDPIEYLKANAQSIADPAERARVTAEIDGLARLYPTESNKYLAPNGKASNLNHAQWYAVRTPSFKQWFGDWETRANAEWVFNAEPTSSLSGEEFKKSETDLIAQVDGFFKSIGGTVEREGLGVVELTRQGIRSSIAHGIGRDKAAAFKAVPDIIKNGKIIDHQTNWKGRGYDTCVIDAPIKIGTTDYIAEVIIEQNQTKKNEYYLHEVEIKEKAQSAFKTATERSAPQASHLIIAKKLSDVKPDSVSKVVDENGEPLVVWHQAKAEIEIFEPHRKGAGEFDSETPFGIFLKPDDNDIGLSGKNQIPLIARITNPLRATDRTELRRYLEDHIENYADIHKQYTNSEQEYGDRAKTLEAEQDRRFAEWETQNPSAVFLERGDAWDRIENEIGLQKNLNDWNSAENKFAAEMKELADRHFRNSEFDGIIIDKDEGSIGKKTTKTYIALDSNQIKSAIGNAGTYNAGNPSILFQLDDQLVEDAAGYESWQEFRDAYEGKGRVILEGKPVASVSSQDIPIINGKPINTAEAWIEQNPVGTVQTVIGEVKVEKSGITNSMSHTHYPNKVFVLSAIKPILENGAFLSELDDFNPDTNIKNYYFAAPVELDGERKIVFVRVRQIADSDNEFYVHEVFTEDEVRAAAPLGEGLDKRKPGGNDSHRLSRPGSSEPGNGSNAASFPGSKSGGNPSDLYRSIINNVLTINPRAKATDAWYRSLWKDARKIHNTLFQGDEEKQTRAQSLDKRWSDEADREYLSGALVELYRIHNDASLEPGADEADARGEYERTRRLKGRIEHELPNAGSLIGIAAQVNSGRRLSSTQYDRIKQWIRKDTRGYRSVFADLMGQEEYLEDLAENIEGEPAARLANPRPDRADTTERLKEIGREIGDPALQARIESGEAAFDDPQIAAYEKGQNAEYEKAKAALEALEKETGEDFARLSNDVQRRMVELYEKMLAAKEKTSGLSEKMQRELDEGIAGADYYRKQARLERANYEQAYKAYADYQRAHGIEADTREALARRDARAAERVKQTGIRRRMRALRALKEIKQKLIKRITRNVSFDNVAYDQAVLIKTIQRIFEPSIIDGVNKWIGGRDGPLLREVWSRWSTDEAFREQLIDAAGEGKAGRLSGILNKNWDFITTGDKRALIKLLPKADFVRELALEELAAENEESVQLDIEERVVNGKAYIILGAELERKVKETLGEELYNRVQNIPLGEWSLTEAEELARVVDLLTVHGRKELAAKREARRNLDARYRRQVIDMVKTGGIEINADDPPEEKERKRAELARLAKRLDRYAAGTKKNHFWNNFFDANLRHFTTAMDGGRKGIFTNLLYWGENDAYNAEQRAVAARRLLVDTVMKENNITLDELYQSVEIPGFDKAALGENIDLYRVSGGRITVDDLLYIMRGSRNEETRKAIMYGNLSNAAEREYYKGRKDDLDEIGAFANIAHSRLMSVLSFAKDFFDQEENKKFLKLAEAVGADYDRNGERLNKACIEMFNRPMWRVEDYVPMNRREQTGGENENRVIEDLLGVIGAGQKWVGRGFTEKRINISPYHQAPIELGLYKTWAHSVTGTEHLIAYGPLVQTLNAVFKGYDTGAVRQAVQDRWGAAATRRIAETIAEFASPEPSRHRSELDQFVRTLRGKTATAYLAWKLSGVLKQAVTSPWPYLQEISPPEYLRAALEVAGGFGRVNGFIREKSIYMRNRDFDPMVKLIKEAMDQNENRLLRGVDRFNALGMKGLEAVDWAAVAPGWLAAYRRELVNIAKEQEAEYQKLLKKYHGSEWVDVLATEESKANKALTEILTDEEQDAEAVARADDAVRRMQPSSRAADIAPMFKNKSEIANAFLQFQMALNVIWQNIRYDLPLAVKEKQVLTVAGMVTGYALAGIGLGLLLDDDDDEQKEERNTALWILYNSLTQFTDAVPLVGDGVNALAEKTITGKTGFHGQQGILPVVQKAFGGLENTAGMVREADPQKRAEKFARAVANMGEAFGLSFGLPVSGGKELLRAAGVGDGDGDAGLYPEAVLGRRR